MMVLDFKPDRATRMMFAFVMVLFTIAFLTCILYYNLMPLFDLSHQESINVSISLSLIMSIASLISVKIILKNLRKIRTYIACKVGNMSFHRKKTLYDNQAIPQC